MGVPITGSPVTARGQLWVRVGSGINTLGMSLDPPIPAGLAASARSSGSGPGRVRTLARSARLGQESLVLDYRTPLILLTRALANTPREHDSRSRAEAAEVLRIEPKYTIQGTQARISCFKRQEDTEHYFDGLRKAGLPER